MQESLIVDGHVHLYPVFNMRDAVKCSLDNFIQSRRTIDTREDPIKVWMLTERSDTALFAELPAMDIPGYRVVPTEEPESLVVQDKHTHEPLVYILAGRQIVSSEGLEVCALATHFQCRDRSTPTRELIEQINNVNGLAALNWAPGKWFFKRGKVVREILDSVESNKLYIGDTTMRPTIWPTPRLFLKAESRGIRVISGSDPLPFKGEEQNIGTYAMFLTGDFDDTRPAASIRLLLKNRQTRFTVCGKRSGPIRFMIRQYKIMRK